MMSRAASDIVEEMHQQQLGLDQAEREAEELRGSASSLSYELVELATEAGIKPGEMFVVGSAVFEVLQNGNLDRVLAKVLSD